MIGLEVNTLLNYFVLPSISAIPKLREKRSLAQERCPKTMSEQQCADYAAEESKNKEYCHRYYVGGHHIEWQR